MSVRPRRARPPRLVGGRPRRRRRHRRLRLRRRRQPHPPRCAGHRPRRVGRRATAARRRTLLEILGADRAAGARAPPPTLPDDVDLVVTSPGLAPRRAAAGPGRRPAASRCGARSSSPGGCATPSAAVPWLAVTGTNGKTTTVQMLDAMLRAGGLRSVACGNVGLPLVEAVDGPDASVRRAGRRALQLPAALHALGGLRVGRGAQRRRGPPRLVRLAWRTTPPTRAASTRASSGPASTTSPTR